MWKKKTLLQAFSRKYTFLLETNYSYIFQESIIYTRERRKLWNNDLITNKIWKGGDKSEYFRKINRTQSPWVIV